MPISCGKPANKYEVKILEKKFKISMPEDYFDAYRRAYSNLDDIKVDVKSPNGTYSLDTNVTPVKAVDLIEAWLKEQGLM
ncbi:TPA: hypothetical protein QCJ60_004245 [Enterobacter sichuanensis]|nr:hypothetical protein [Enterobacter sichuanensis]